MSWLKEAQDIISKKNSHETPSNDECLSLDNESIVKELKKLYENATEREIKKALNEAKAAFSPPYNKKEVMIFLRNKLED